MASQADIIKFKQQQAAQNKNFLDYSKDQYVQLNALNSNTYAQGATMNFECPVIPGAFVKKLVIRHNITVALPTGAVATLNAAAPFNLVNQLRVNFGGAQHVVHPFIYKVLEDVKGFGRNRPETTLTNQSSGVQGMLYSAPAVTANATNTWKFDLEVPLTAIPGSMEGALPIGQNGTKLQVQAVLPAAFFGVDPVDNVATLSGVSASAVTFGGTIQIFAVYNDFTSPSFLQTIQPSLQGLGTVQMLRINDNALTANTWNFKDFGVNAKVLRKIAIVVDGNSSATFAAPSNITGYEVDKSGTQNQKLFAFDDTNGNMSFYYEEIRQRYGGDLNDGVIIYDGIGASPNPSNRAGKQILNLSSSGYSTARAGYKVTSVSGVAGITPRVITHLQVLSDDGIRMV